MDDSPPRAIAFGSSPLVSIEECAEAVALEIALLWEQAQSKARVHDDSPSPCIELELFTPDYDMQMKSRAVFRCCLAIELTADQVEEDEEARYTVYYLSSDELETSDAVFVDLEARKVDAFTLKLSLREANERSTPAWGFEP
ncbi:hypothetical protein [Brachybacterium sp. ACRRE]|uniref:hypothetical protein n=1 Tax=Brachybacterium sp. ACRRE TaxID=2918184 RepID=UPI001EF2A2C9|nr:hypothetical protein [Brachybacterium sp. ACRRE]MCG7309698.1 hypothetical protein [Brachybacterium sp. ACRRE]